MDHAIVERIWENELKDGRKYWTLQMDGQRYSIWDPEMATGLSPGLSVEYEAKKSGRYNTIKSLRILEESSDPPETPEQPLVRTDPRNRRITRMGCLKYATTLLTRSELDSPDRVDRALEIAKKFEKYVTDEELSGNPALE